MKVNGEFVQFSKIMVIIVVSAVTIIHALSVIDMLYAQEYAYIASILKGYTEFAAIVFAAYSGNSAVEKWLIHRASHSEIESEDKG